MVEWHRENFRKLPREFYDRDTVEVARQLLGCVLVRPYQGEWLAGMIVETEAYLGESDPASHAYRGRTPRTEIMYGPPGFSYVYLIYGMYHCLNFVTEREGKAAAVLIRALEPVSGIEIMQQLRRTHRLEQLTSGPGKLCQALAIDDQLNGVDLTGERLFVVEGKTFPPSEIVQTTRIGIRAGTDKPWRFYVKGNRFVSTP